MSQARHDTDALARFLSTVRPDWNLGTVATQLAREHPTDEQWPELALAAVALALTHPAATPRELHAPSCSLISSRTQTGRHSDDH